MYSKKYLLVLLLFVGVIGAKDKKAPKSPNLYAKGKKCLERGDFGQALTCFRALCSREPENHHARYELACAHLACSHFRKGFDEMHEYLMRQAPLERQWRGEDLTGKSIAVYAPQDLQDTLFCAYYIKELQKRGGSVTVVVNQPVVNIFASDIDISQIEINLDFSEFNFYESTDIEISRRSPKTDFEVHLMSLPSLLKCRVYERKEPYLCCDPARELFWKDSLSADSKLRVGVMLKNLCSDNEPAKSDMLQALLAIPGVTVYCLDRDEEMVVSRIAGKQECCVRMMADDMERAQDRMSELAALMRNLDCVVCAPGMEAQLALGMKVCTWVTVPCCRSWHYCSPASECSPWAPWMFLANQNPDGTWRDASKMIVQRIESMRNECRK